MDTSLALGDRGAGAFLAALLFTQVLETPIYFLALRRFGPARRWRRNAAIAFAASLITHPIVWFVVPLLWGACYARAVAWGAAPLGLVARTWSYGVCAEGFAVVAEAMFLRACKLRGALAWSLGANAVSALGGLAWRGLQP